MGTPVSDPEAVLSHGLIRASDGAYYPNPADVTLGVEYGPGGDDYTGTKGTTSAASFAAQLALDTLNIFLNTDHFAEVVTYTNVGETGVQMRAVWTDYKDDLRQNEHTRTHEQRARVDLSLSASYGITMFTPNKDKVTRGGVEWLVLGLSDDGDASNGQGMITLTLAASSKEKWGKESFARG